MNVTTPPSAPQDTQENPQDIQEWDASFVETLVQSIQSQYQKPVARGSTYRLQFTAAAFRFSHASAIAPYLRNLGITHIYASPYLKTRHQSSHGYDVVDPTRVNDELGTSVEYQTYLESLAAHGLKHIIDVVPNHMCVGTDENAWWLDVLMNGPSSPYAGYFDIDWEPVKRELTGKVLLPILGDFYGKVLESGELKLHFRDGAFWIQCHASYLPLDPQTWHQILARGIDELANALDAGSEAVLELRSILTALQYLPTRTETTKERVAERCRERVVIQNRLRRLAAEHETILQHIQANLTWFNGEVGQSASFDALDRLLDDQAFRLVHWKAGSDELNYRRFFDVTELAALCMENLDVFQATHQLVLQLLAEGKIDGFRIDHIDGLFDPIEYLWRLQWSYLRTLGQQALVHLRPHSDALQLWKSMESSVFESLHRSVGGPHPAQLFLSTRPSDVPEESQPSELPKRFIKQELPAYVVVEKILGIDEPLPSEWPIAGTTGYDFLNLVNGVFVDPKGLDAITRHYERFTESNNPFREIVYDCKRLILSTSMQSEVQLLAHRLDRLSHRHRRSRDFTLQALRAALREIIACFPVYRTYIRGATVSPRDRRVIQQAVAQAMRRNPNTDRSVFQFIRDVLLLQQPENLDSEGMMERELFIGRFQQVTSPVMAKGVEDTAFYRYVPLTSLEEVGGEPIHALRSVDAFHAQNRERQAEWPETMLATTTHDTKRSEDVRARINVLSEWPSGWRAVLQRWTRWNRKFRQDVEGNDSPSRNDEWLFYQSLVGIWPVEKPGAVELQSLCERLGNYLEKASHEAKTRTSWINPDARYDSAVRQFVEKTLAPSHGRFIEDVHAFVTRIRTAGLVTSLSQTLLKLTSPGIPDIYQGQECWDFSLVDPDNRRPVDYAKSQRLLEEIQAAAATSEGRCGLAQYLAQHPEDERTKLFTTWTLLQFRRDYFKALTSYDYRPLKVSGERAEHLIAYAWVPRKAEKTSGIIIVAPRLLYRLGELSGIQPIPFGKADFSQSIWRDTEVDLAGMRCQSVQQIFTGQSYRVPSTSVRIAEVLEDFPLAVLISD